MMKRTICKRWLLTGISCVVLLIAGVMAFGVLLEADGTQIGRLSPDEMAMVIGAGENWWLPRGTSPNTSICSSTQNTDCVYCDHTDDLIADPLDPPPTDKREYTDAAIYEKTMLGWFNTKVYHSSPVLCYESYDCNKRVITDAKCVDDASCEDEGTSPNYTCSEGIASAMGTDEYEPSYSLIDP